MRELFESLRGYCHQNLKSIPLMFVLGFYVSLIGTARLHCAALWLTIELRSEAVVGAVPAAALAGQFRNDDGNE